MADGDWGRSESQVEKNFGMQRIQAERQQLLLSSTSGVALGAGDVDLENRFWGV